MSRFWGVGWWVVIWGCSEIRGGVSGGCMEHKFCTARIKSIKDYISGILTSRAINWYMYESNPGGDRVGWPPTWFVFWGLFSIFFWATPTEPLIYHRNPQLNPSRLAPLLGDLIKGEGLGAWSYKCMECPQVGRGGVFRQVTSNWFQTCSLRIALCISCMNEVKKYFGKRFGWICALNRWSVQERVHSSFAL